MYDDFLLRPAMSREVQHCVSFPSWLIDVGSGRVGGTMDLYHNNLLKELSSISHDTIVQNVPSNQGRSQEFSKPGQCGAKEKNLGPLLCDYGLGGRMKFGAAKSNSGQMSRMHPPGTVSTIAAEPGGLKFPSPWNRRWPIDAIQILGLSPPRTPKLPLDFEKFGAPGPCYQSSSRIYFYVVKLECMYVLLLCGRPRNMENLPTPSMRKICIPTTQSCRLDVCFYEQT